MKRLTPSVLVALLIMTHPSPSLAQDLRVLPAKVDGTPTSKLLYANLAAQADEAFARREAELDALASPDDVQAYQKRMHNAFVDALGGFPPRTPLNAKVVGTLKRDGYTVEKVIYESQPQHYVTAVLYLPTTKPPFPGVLMPCGHSRDGKANAVYQRVGILMARNGIAVLCYDPIDQGERMQIVDDQGKSPHWGTTSHTMLAVGSIPLGRGTATFRIFDGIRSIDYLTSRPDIDPQRIGCTGNSGGGTLTSYIMAVDPRVACAAPSCYLTSLKRLIATIGPQDAEQDIFGQIAFGMDHGDYVMMRAPKPTLMCTATHDFFDITGSWDTFRRAKRFYTNMGYPQRVSLVEANAKHGFSKPLREAATRWMRRWLLHVDDAVTEVDLPVASESELQCSPRGQVMLIPGARSVYDLNRQLESRLASDRRAFWAKTDAAEARAAVRRITGIATLGNISTLTAERSGAVQRDGYTIQKMVLRRDGALSLPALAFIPAKADGDAYLYLHGDGKAADAAPGGPIEKLVRGGHLVLAVDLPGVGETGGGGKPMYESTFGSLFNEFFLSYMLGRSLVAIRAEDTLACARFLANYHAEGKANRVHMIAVGTVGPPALHAAALEPDLFASLRLQRSLRSWADIVQSGQSRDQLNSTVNAALKVYDLPDLATLLAKDKLTIVEPVNAMGEPVSADAPARR